MLTAWAAAGYVVAAPLFPLSSSETPGGPDGGDIGSQPGDMSFVIGQMLKASSSPERTSVGLDRTRRNWRRRPFQRCHHHAGPGGQHLLSRHAGQGGGRHGRHDRGPRSWPVRPGRGAAAPRRLRISTTGSFPTAMPSPSSTRHGDQRPARPRLGPSFGHDGLDGPHGLVRGGRTDVDCGHFKSTTAFFDAYLKHEHASTAGGRGRRPHLPVDRAHRLDPGITIHAARPQGGGGPSARNGHAQHRSAQWPDRHRSVERLHPGQGGQHPGVLHGRDLHCQLSGLQLCPRRNICIPTPPDRVRSASTSAPARSATVCVTRRTVATSWSTMPARPTRRAARS